MIKNSRAFGHIEVLLAIVLIASIAVSVWFTTEKRQDELSTSVGKAEKAVEVNNGSQGDTEETPAVPKGWSEYTTPDNKISFYRPEDLKVEQTEVLLRGRSTSKYQFSNLEGRPFRGLEGEYYVNLAMFIGLYVMDEYFDENGVNDSTNTTIRDLKVEDDISNGNKLANYTIIGVGNGPAENYLLETDEGLVIVSMRGDIPSEIEEKFAYLISTKE